MKASLKSGNLGLLSTLLLTMLITMANPTAIYAQDIKLGVVNVQVLLEQALQISGVTKALEAEFSTRDKKLVAQQTEIKNLESKVERDSAIMSEVELRKVERDLQAQKRDLKRASTEFREDVNIRKNELLAKTQKDVMEVIKSVAEKEGYDLIFGEGVVYAGARVDVTPKILETFKSRSK